MTIGEAAVSRIVEPLPGRGSIPFPEPGMKPVILTDEGDPVCWSWSQPPPGSGGTGLRAAELLVEWCRYRCAVCGVSHPGIALFMDHDHETGLCRGVLCQYCNTAEGRGGGRLLGKYRERPPAVICGVRVRYCDYAWSIPRVAPGTWELRAWQWEPAGASFWPLRDGKPWKKEELLLAARPDLTNDQVARLTQRSLSGVTARRKRVLGVDYDVIVERARRARAARRHRAEKRAA
jgi:hypothetical protein